MECTKEEINELIDKYAQARASKMDWEELICYATQQLADDIRKNSPEAIIAQIKDLTPEVFGSIH